jgi:5,10-methenyltetrahydrofolate synthetase
MGTPRSQLRQSLLAQRDRMDATERGRADETLRSSLLQYLLGHIGYPLEQAVIACYWPIRGEPDLRPLWPGWGVVALPVIVGRQSPLRFAQWHVDEPTRMGEFGIPVPLTPRWIEPQIIVAPCLGFYLDSQGRRFRIGYGGGYYDRTLAILNCSAIGVSYSYGRLDDFVPERHDIALDAIITETQSY